MTKHIKSIILVVAIFSIGAIIIAAALFFTAEYFNVKPFPDIDNIRKINISQNYLKDADEEIDEKAFQVPYDNTKDFYDLQFIKGAKWMRDKIQGGNK